MVQSMYWIPSDLRLWSPLHDSTRRVFAHDNTISEESVVKLWSLTQIRAGVRLNRTEVYTDAQDQEGDMYALDANSFGWRAYNAAESSSYIMAAYSTSDT